MTTSAALLLWFLLACSIRFVVVVYVDALQARPSTIIRHWAASSSRSIVAPSLRLHGISEWRAKYSSSSSTTQGTDDGINNDDSLPLLLLPFSPSEILLPGQSATMKFKHGRYMDMIDEALNSYESVLGMSILDDDGPLPFAVLCEVHGEDLVVNAGYRGFSSMEVGVRAVGRARRTDVVAREGGGGEIGDGGGGSTGCRIETAYRGRASISDHIHIGKYEEYHDAVVISGDELEMASEYSRSIEGIVRSGAAFEEDECREPHDDRARRRRMLFERAYEMIMEHAAAQNPPFATATTARGDGQRRLQAHLMAVSWASLAALDDHPSPSIITRALSTNNTVERLRLGLAMLLEGRIPHDGETRDNRSSSNESDFGRGNTFQ